MGLPLCVFVCMCTAQELCANIQYQSSFWRKNSHCGLVSNQSQKIPQVIFRQLSPKSYTGIKLSAELLFPKPILPEPGF